MFAGGAENIKDAQALEQSIARWMELKDSGASFEDIQRAELEVAEALKQAPFELKAKLPFFQQLVKKFDAAQAFQQFRLPGSERVVVDRREEHSRGKSAEQFRQASKEAAKREASGLSRDGMPDLRLKDGRLVAQKDKGQAPAADKPGAGLRAGLEQKVASERVERMLSAFEKMVIARFEEGKEVAQGAQGGKPSFLQKSAAQWREFFMAFLDRTVSKKALLSEIREFLFRGLVQKGGKGIMIGDLNFTSGRVEKFVRFSILAEAMARLKALLPGDALARGALANLTGEELMYLALAVSRARDMGFAALPSQGKFMGSRAEEQAASALGMQLEQQLMGKAKGLRGRRGRGLFSGDLLGEEGPIEDLPYRFVHWWNLANLAKPGKLRWVTAVIYGSLLILSLVGIALMTLRILGGS